MTEYIEFKTDTGNGKARKFIIEGEEFISLSKRDIGPLYDKEEALKRAKEEGFYTVVKTSVGTYYLKCHKDDITRFEVLMRLDKMWRTEFKKCRTTYFLKDI